MNTRNKNIAIAALAIALSFAAFALLISNVNRRGDLTKAFKDFTALARSNESSKIYSGFLSSAYTRYINESAFSKLMEDYSSCLGYAFDKKIVRINFFKDKGGRGMAHVVSVGLYAGGIANESYIFRKEPRGWKIVYFDVQSPLLTKEYKDKINAYLKGMPLDSRNAFLKMMENQGIRPKQED